MTLHETYYRDITPGEKNEQRDNSALHDMRSTVRCFQCDNRFSMNSINFVRLISPPRDYADILPHTVTPESAVTDSFPHQPSCYQPNNVQAISQAVTLLYTIELLCPLLSMLSIPRRGRQLLHDPVSISSLFPPNNYNSMLHV